ncbi:HD domain-containing protein, partial [Limnohabitans sp.]|uniref:HD domain-containing protein n=1 Tax=Limnohabitans sp. TaxID=1907725 RepID=UPI003919E1C5
MLPAADVAAQPLVLRAIAGDGQTEELLQRARAFAHPLIAGEHLDTGENIWDHAQAVAGILDMIGGSLEMQAASFLVYACPHLNRPQEVIAKAFGAPLAELAVQTNHLLHVQRLSRTAGHGDSSADPRLQTENVRKMLLAFSRDLRVVMLRLASRLQTLRHHAQVRLQVPPALARESLQVFAPLANRLGIWQVKWELEDLAFRFT